MKKILNFLKSRRGLVVSVPVGLVVFYTLLGFFGVPLVIEKIVPYFLKEKAVLSIENAKFNPFTYELNLTKVDLATQKPLFKADKIDGKLNFKELFNKALNVEILRFEKPEINIEREHNASFNFDVFIHDSNDTKSAKDEKESFFNVILNHMKVQNGSLVYKDFSLYEPFDIKFDKIDYEIKGIDLLKKTIGKHSLGATSQTIENVKYNAEIDINPLKIYGNIEINKLKINPFWLSFLDNREITIQDGFINSKIIYFLTIDNGLHLGIEKANLELEKIKIIENNNTVLVDSLNIPMLSFGASFAKDKNATLSVNEVTLSSVKYADMVDLDDFAISNFILNLSSQTNSKIESGVDKITLNSFKFKDGNISSKLSNLEILDINAIGEFSNVTELNLDFSSIKFNEFNTFIKNQYQNENLNEEFGFKKLSLDDLNTTFKSKDSEKNIKIALKNSTILDINSSAKFGDFNTEDIVANGLNIDIVDENSSLNLANLKVTKPKFKNQNIAINLDFIEILSIASTFLNENNTTNLSANLDKFSLNDINATAPNFTFDSNELNITKPKFSFKDSEFALVLPLIQVLQNRAKFDKFGLDLAQILVEDLNASSKNGAIKSKISHSNLDQIAINYAEKSFIRSNNLVLENSEFFTDKNSSILALENASLAKTALFSNQKEFSGFEKLSVNEAKFDIPNQNLSITKISLNSPNFSSNIDEKGASAINELGFLNTGASQNAQKQSQNPQKNSLKFHINEAEISNGSLKINEAFSPKPIEHNVDNINISALNLSSNFSVPFDLKTNIDAKILSLKTNGKVSISPFLIDLNLDTTAKNLGHFTPYVQQFLRASIKSGVLAFNGKFKFDKKMALEGKLALKNFEMLDDKNTKFFSVNSVNVANTKLTDSSVSLTKIDINSPYSKLFVQKDKKFNILEMIKSSPEKTSKPAKKGSNFSINLSNISVNDGSMDFSDYSLFLPFNTKITKLKSSIDEISEKKLAKIKLSGVVGTSGLGQIELETLPFSYKDKTNFTMLFKDVELSDVTPYSAKFIGYEIENGVLNLKLNYIIENSKLSATNNINFDTLTLGKKIESPDNLNLPVQLAISILKDQNNQITLNLPVSGDLNDPEFSYGGIIWGAVGKLFSDIVLSPFRLIGNVLGIETEHLNGIDFAVASSEILDSELEKINDLVKIAKEKPDIKLTLTPTYNEKADTWGFKKINFDEAVSFLMSSKLLTYKNAIKSLQASYLIENSADVEKQLIKAQKFDKAKLEILAKQRVENLKEKLESMGVASSQIVVKNVTQTQSKQDSFVPVLLGIEN